MRLYFVGHAFQRKVSVGEDLAGFLFEPLQFLILGTEMPDEQPLYAGLPGDGRGLGGGAVETSAGLDLEVFEIGRFMIKEIYAADIICDAFVECGISRIGIGPGLVGGFGYPLIFDDSTVFFLIALAPFQPIEKGSRNVVLASLLGIDPAKRPDFAEDEPPAFDTVDNGETADFVTGFPEEDGGLFGNRRCARLLAEGMDLQRVRKMDVSHPELKTDDLPERARSVNMELLRSAEQAHTGQEADQPKVVITVQMGNEDMVDLTAADLVFGHLHLGAFAAIDQKDLVFHGDDLRGRMTIKSR